jgi:excisionase family DNA binding protein
VTTNKPSPTVARKYYSLKDGASYSGFSVYTLRELINSGELPAYRLSGRAGAEMRIKLSDLDALLEPVIPPAIYAERAARQRHPLHRPLPLDGH